MLASFIVHSTDNCLKVATTLVRNILSAAHPRKLEQKHKTNVLQ